MTEGGEYRGYRDAGVRLSEPMAPELEGTLATLRSATPLLKGLHMFDKAHLVMLAERGLVPRSCAAQCLRALLEMETQGADRLREETGSGIHSGEAYLVRRLGLETGGCIHAGRSSGDLTWVSERIRIRDDLLSAMRVLNGYREALLELALRHTRTVMPHYTHGQQAMPATLALYLHSYACAAARDFDRLAAAYDTVNVSPAGTAAGDASRFPLDRERTAELMGFDRACANTMDPSHHDHIWQSAGALAMLDANLGSFADLLVAWCGQEYRFVQVADRYCHTSSIFAHKRNPQGVLYAQRVRDDVTGRTPTSFSLSALAAAAESTARALTIMEGVVRTLKVDRERMLRTVSSFWAQIPDLGAVIAMEKGLPWRTAHQIVGTLVRLAEEEGKGPDDVTPELLDRAACAYCGKPVHLSERALQKALDPMDCVGHRSMTGGAASSEMERQIALARRRLENDCGCVAAKAHALEDADRKLEEAVLAITG